MAEYIEREAAIDYLHFVCVPQCRKYAQEEIKKIPAADVQPVRHGRWRLGGYGQISDATTKWYDQFLQGGFLYCSVCKCRANRKSDYCPNCGAKMDGGD